MRRRILFAYSGSARSAAALGSLVGPSRYQVSTLSLDVGQGDDLDAVRASSLAGMAARAHVLDVREELAREFVFPMLRGGVFRTPSPSMLAAATRPVIARKLVEIGGIEEVGVVAHACSSKLARLAMERLVHALNPALEVVAADPSVVGPGRQRLLDASLVGYCEEEGSARAGSARSRVTATADAGRDGALVEVAFAGGVPIAINDVAMSAVELLESLNLIAWQHGVGRITTSDSDGAVVGHLPGVAVLQAAYREVLGHDRLRAIDDRSGRYARLVEQGGWFTAERVAMDDETRELVNDGNAVVRVRLANGSLMVTSVQATATGLPMVDAVTGPTAQVMRT